MEPFAVSWTELTIATLAAAVIALAALKRGLLDTSGALAACLLGPALVATGGWWLGAILIAFFVSSSLLPSPATESPSRTWHQVAANGGPALALSTIGLLTEHDRLLVGAAATIAATTADTWATEIGRALGGVPWSLRSRSRVPAGTSGAVTPVGLFASAAGAVFIATVTILLAPIAPVGDLDNMRTGIIVALCGVLGSTADTLLGATLQARFRCKRCAEVSEDATDHRPGHPMVRISGVRWMTNSIVNLSAAAIAGLAAIALAG